MTHYISLIHRHLDQLSEAYAPNTLRSYYADSKAFVDWCMVKKFTPFPLNPHTLRQFIEEQNQLSYATIRRRVGALRRVNTILGYEDHSRTEEVYIALRKLKRSRSHAQKQATGINWSLLEKMIASQPNTVTGIRNRALISIGYDFLARRSELAALKSSDVTILPDGSLRGIIRRSKSDQLGRGRLVFGSERSTHLLKKWLRVRPKDIDALFCPTVHNKFVDRHLCDKSVNDIIKRSVIRVKGCNRPSDRDISGHSLRVGAAQDLLRQGHDLTTIMRAGGWSNASIVLRYVRYAEHNIWQSAPQNSSTLNVGRIDTSRFD